MEQLEGFLLVAPILLFSMVAHEYAHGYAALRQGDPTARDLGRLSWNPARHIDPVLTILLPIITFFGSGMRFAFGGAKPIPVDPSRYRHYRRGDIIVSLAGVAANLVVALLCALVVVLAGQAGRTVVGAAGPLRTLQTMMLYGIMINFSLIGFNLLPVPPLDGSHVVKHLLPPAWAIRYQQFGRRYGMLLLILLIGIGRGVIDAWMRPAFAATDALIRAVSPYALGARVL